MLPILVQWIKQHCQKLPAQLKFRLGVLMVKDTVQHWDTAVQRSALVKEKLKNNINSFTIKVRYGLSSEIKAFRILHLIKQTNGQ